MRRKSFCPEFMHILYMQIENNMHANGDSLNPRNLFCALIPVFECIYKNSGYLNLYGIFLFCLKRYEANKFRKHEPTEEELGDTTGYNFYVRPFISFWTTASMDFERVLRRKEVAKAKWKRNDPNEDVQIRYVMRRLTQVWLDRNAWFDEKREFEMYEEGLKQRISSKARQHLPTLEENILLDSFMLYQHLNFQHPEHEPNLSFFPVWNVSKAVSVLAFNILIPRYLHQAIEYVSSHTKFVRVSRRISNGKEIFVAQF